MKAFRFSLETLLGIRREEELEKKLALAAVTGQLVRIQNSLKALSADRERVFLASSHGLEDLRLRDLYWVKSIQEASALDVERERFSEAREEAQKHYAEAHSRRLALDRVRERRHEDWRRRMRREETRLLDEAGGRSGGLAVNGGSDEER